MKSALESFILWNAPTLDTSLWSKVWCFLSFGWANAYALSVLPPSNSWERSHWRTCWRKIQGFLGRGGDSCLSSSSAAYCPSNPLLTTLNAIQSQSLKLFIHLFCLPCLQILVTAVDGGNLSKARLDMLLSTNTQHMKKCPGGIVPTWTVIIAVQA